MLQRRLTGALYVTLAATTLVACGDKPIEDNLVRPGITALEDSRDLACGSDATTIRLAIDAYTALNGEPPSNEAALVDADLLRTASEGWDVVDGELVAQDPQCGPVGDSAAEPSTVDIVTDSVPISPEEILTGMSAGQIDGVGGIDCARELVTIFAAGERYVAEQDADPVGFDDLVAAGYLTERPVRWAIAGDELVPIEGSGCVAPTTLDTAPTTLDAECRAQRATLEVAREAYAALTGSDAIPTEADLVAEGLLRDETQLVDFDEEGIVIAAPGSGCEPHLDD